MDFITHVRLTLNKPNESNLAFGRITIADALDVPFYVRKAGNGKEFVSFIRIKKQDGTYTGTIFPRSREISEYINQTVLSVYFEQVGGKAPAKNHSEKTMDEIPDIKGGIESKQAKSNSRIIQL